MIDTTPLAKALATLEEALEELDRHPNNKFVRDASIQRFEYTYELSHRLLKRFLSETEASPSEVNELSFADLIRRGNQRGLLDTDWPQWQAFRRIRNITSHTYDEEKATEVIEALPPFVTAVKYLLRELSERSAGLK